MPHPPVYSFVATSRNDDHGGDVLRRTQSFITQLAEQAERHEVACELVLVEWNPPMGRAPLADVLGWPAAGDWFQARIITVPPDLHSRFYFSKRLAMFQMIAKNVGIRRAAGRYAIATNIDIVFSDALFEWLKVGKARPGVVYRSDLWDIPNQIQLEPDLNRLLRRASEEHIRRNLVDGTHIRRGDQFLNAYGEKVDHAILFPVTTLLHKVKEFAFDAEALAAFVDRIISTDIPKLRRDFLIPALHTNGCGDFTMMAREDWFALRGYPEWHVFSWNINSVIIFQAFYDGIAVEVLESECVHYHIEHDYGSGWTPEGATSLWSRLAQQGLPCVDYKQFYEVLYELQDNATAGKFSVYNDPDWGLARHDLELKIIADSPACLPVASNTAPVNENFLDQLVPVHPGISLADGRPSILDLAFEIREDDERNPEIAIESLPATWSYAWLYDVPSVAQCGEFWVRFDVIVESGNLVIGVLNKEGSDFLSQMACGGADTRVQHVYAHIKNIAEAGTIVLRNVTPDDQPTRFRIKGVMLLREETGSDGPAIYPDIGDNGAAGLCFAALALDARPDNTTEPLVPAEPIAVTASNASPAPPPPQTDTHVSDDLQGSSDGFDPANVVRVMLDVFADAPRTAHIAWFGASQEVFDLFVGILRTAGFKGWLLLDTEFPGQVRAGQLSLVEETARVVALAAADAFVFDFGLPDKEGVAGAPSQPSDTLVGELLDLIAAAERRRRTAGKPPRRIVTLNATGHTYEGLIRRLAVVQASADPRIRHGLVFEPQDAAGTAQVALSA